MNGGLVPLMLLSTTIGLMLAFVQGRGALLALTTYSLAAVLGFAIPLGLSAQIIFVGLWLSAIAAAIAVYIPVARWSLAAVPLCLVAGYWLGACATLSGSGTALALGLSPALVAIPARAMIRHKFEIVIKVVASWMIAIAALSLFVSLIATPGYKPDHME